MRFQPVKCNMMQLTRKHSYKIQASYNLEGTVLENVDYIKYLGVTIQGRRRQYGRSGHSRTTFLAENGLSPTPFSADYILFIF